MDLVADKGLGEFGLTLGNGLEGEKGVVGLLLRGTLDMGLVDQLQELVQVFLSA